MGPATSVNNVMFAPLCVFQDLPLSGLGLTNSKIALYALVFADCNQARIRFFLKPFFCFNFVSLHVMLSGLMGRSI